MSPASQGELLFFIRVNFADVPFLLWVLPSQWNLTCFAMYLYPYTSLEILLNSRHCNFFSSLTYVTTPNTPEILNILAFRSTTPRLLQGFSHLLAEMLSLPKITSDGWHSFPHFQKAHIFKTGSSEALGTRHVFMYLTYIHETQSWVAEIMQARTECQKVWTLPVNMFPTCARLRP